MSLRHRIQAAERHLRIGEGCPACGRGPGAPVLIKFAEIGDRTPLPDPPVCPACGEPEWLNFVEDGRDELAEQACDR